MFWMEIGLHIKWGKSMDDSLMPDWMKRAKEASDLREAVAANAATEHVIAQMKVTNEGPAYWKELTEKLGFHAGFLQKAFGLNGTANVSDSHGGEVLCRVDVNLHALVPKSAYVNLFYRPGGSLVRCHAPFGGGGDFRLGVVDGKVILMCGGEYRNPEQAASYIIEGLVRTVKPDALRQG
jgi:hypothetical protein